ncbi:MAG: DUF1934 family protein [Streptococcaceae bacterium]|nr:DUF1934 family protein [Streptococcaceae bacterium]
MKLLLKNHIEIDGKIETVVEHLEGNKIERLNKTFLEFEDERKIKNLISYNESSLKRIAYSNPKTIMEFSLDRLSETFYEALGWLKIETLEFVQSEKQLSLKYRIFKEEQLLGNYQLEIEMFF